jgi:hypothetical protein
MGVRSNLAAWLARQLRSLGEKLEPGQLLVASPEASAGPQSDSDRNRELAMDLGPAAAEDTTPSEPWQGVRERALGKSLATLRSEALYSLGALHAAHLAAAAVFDDRRLAAAVSQHRGMAVGEEALSKLAEAAAIWHRDSASLGVALTAVGATQVPDMTLAEALEVDEREEQALQAMAEGYQIELKRQLLEETDP